MSLSVRLPNAKQKKRVAARAIACCLLLILPSCKLPTLRPAELGLGLPAELPPMASGSLYLLKNVARTVLRNPPIEPNMSSTALASYPLCTMQFAHFGLPLSVPY